jgi:hypothetical protein
VASVTVLATNEKPGQLAAERNFRVRVRLLVILLMLSARVFALNTPDTRSLVSDDLSCALLEREVIYAETDGIVPVSFCSAVSVLQQPEFLTRVQEEYQKTLLPETRPEFIVQQSATNAWFYINKKQERTDIAEVASRITGTETFDLAYYTQGRRFFGTYQALIHIRLVRSGNETGYTVAVYAYPENGFCRFFARHLNLVEKYFREKTGEISETAVRISTRLCREEDIPPDQSLAATGHGPAPL